MPYVHLRVAGKLTKTQRKAIAAEFSQTLLNIANKPLKATYVVIDEVPRDQWAVGGTLLSEIKKH